MLVVKTGMQTEYQAATAVAASDVLVLTGTQTVDDLKANVPANCTAIISFGMCGGLAPQAVVGKAYIYDNVVTPDVTLPCDVAWRKRLFAATSYHETKCWSSGEFNTANDSAQRAALFSQTGCNVIDDESNAVAEFAKERGIAYIGLRVVSDGAEDNLPPAVLNALNPDGTTNILQVLESVVTDPLQIPSLIQTAFNYQTAVNELNAAAKAIGPYFGWQ